MPGPDSRFPSLIELRHQLELSQWWPQERLQSWQAEQLQRLLRHAYTYLPYYRRRFQQAGIDIRRPMDKATWARIPILSRSELQQRGELIKTRKLPPGHAPTHDVRTSGSTGMPINALGTSLTRLYWNAITLRDHTWHRRDFMGTFAAIRAEGSDKLPPEGLRLADWGPPTNELHKTGPGALFSVQRDVESQAKWLQALNPDYLLTHPSNLMALAKHCLQKGLTLPRLREVRTYGETVSADLREVCREAWNVPLVDMYSSQEVGYIALQCPAHEHYHVQSESVLVEILNEDNAPCALGEVGRVVITTLHNYAMPLIRYAIEDYAEAGAPCPCGRSLPVLNRIMGRQRNMLVLPDGKRTWPTFPVKAWAHIGRIRQMQLVQKSLDSIEVRLVAERSLNHAEESELTEVLRQRFRYPFQMSFVYLERIERGKNLKFEDFISEVSA